MQHLLEKRGIYSSAELGPYAQNLFVALATPPLMRRRVVFPLPGAHAQNMAQLKNLMETGELVPVIDRRYSLDNIVAA